MRRTLALCSIALVAALAGAAVLPSGAVTVGPVDVGVEKAAAQNGGGGGSNIEQAGDNAAKLLAGIVGPVLIIGVGVIAAVALFKREVGIAVSATVIALIAGLFIYSPDSAESAFKGVYEAIF